MSQDDAELYYYLGKAFLTGQYIAAPASETANRTPDLTSEDTARERALAFQLLQYAAKQGCPSAKLQLALMYANGFAAPLDPTTAFDYAQAAATIPAPSGPSEGKAVDAFKSGSAKTMESQAQEQLGIYYAGGVGTSQNSDQAAYYINQSKTSGTSD